MGHFIQTSKKPTIVNAIGAVPKDNSDELRLITDASRPTGSSLNSYMSLESFKFDTVDTAISLLSKDFYQCKLDLRHGYRSVPIHPDDYPLCGLKWYFDGSAHPTYLMDTRLCFGAAKAPQIFQRLTSVITRMMRRRGYSACICYLDDFYMCAASYEDAMAAYECLQELLTSLGFRINRDKSVPPTRELTFLGININTQHQTMSLPQGKLESLQLELLNWQKKRRVTKKELQQILGKLNWAAKVVRAVRPFMRRLINLLPTVVQSHHHIRLSAAAKKDIAWLLSFSMQFNGVAFWLSANPLPDHAMASDATSYAAAAVHSGSC